LNRAEFAGSLRAYFSEEGLGAFLSEDYAKDSLDAGCSFGKVRKEFSRNCFLFSG
jgi:hypothetical protein